MHDHDSTKREADGDSVESNEPKVEIEDVELDSAALDNVAGGSAQTEFQTAQTELNQVFASRRRSKT